MYWSISPYSDFPLPSLSLNCLDAPSGDLQRRERGKAPPRRRAPEEGEGVEEQEEEEDIYPNLFAEDDEEAVQEDYAPNELVHEGDDEANPEQAIEAGLEAPQEADGEEGAADTAQDWIVQIFYHWESVPSDGSLTGLRYSFSLAHIHKISTMVLHMHNSWLLWLSLVPVVAILLCPLIFVSSLDLSNLQKSPRAKVKTDRSTVQNAL